MSEPRLERTIGRTGSGLLSFNGIVGAAIFALPATLLNDWGSLSPYVFLMVAIAAALVIIPFAATAAVFRESGGPATYGLVFGRFAGFELGWIYYVAKGAATAASLSVLADYLGRWWSPIQAGLGRALLIAVACAMLAAINIVGVKRAIQTLGGFTILKALPLAGFAIAALVIFGLPAPPTTFPRLQAQAEAGFLVIFYAFTGFENAVVPAGETKNPAKTLPQALIAVTALTAALYFIVQLGFVATFGDRAPTGPAPLIDMGRAVAGPVGGVILFLAAIFSLFGNLLGGTTATPRVTYAMAARGDLPSWFARVSPHFLTPANSIAFLAIFAGLLAISGGFVWLAVVSTLARMLLYPATILALPFAPGRPRLSALQWLTGAAGIAICLWGATQADAKAWMTLGVLAVVGLILYALASIGRARSAP